MKKFFIALYSLVTFLLAKFNVDEYNYRFEITMRGVKIQGENMNVTVRVGQQFPVKLVGKSADGRDARVEEGTGEWLSSDTSRVVVFEDIVDEQKAVVEVIALGDGSPVLVTFRGDADLDKDEERIIQAVLTVTPSNGEIKTVDFEIGKITDTEVVNEDNEEAPADTETEEA